MIPNKKYFALSGLALLAMIFVACNDDDPTEVYVGNMPQYQKAYITTGVSYPNGTIFNGVFSFGKLQLDEEDKVIFTEGNNMVLSGTDSFDTDIFFRTTYPVKKAISGTVALRSDAEEFVTLYNTEHQSEYKILPVTHYTIENAHATIQAGSMEAVIGISVNTDIGWERGEYLLPLELTLDNGSAVSLSEDRNFLCLQYSIVAPPESDYPAKGRILARDEFDFKLINGSDASLPENAFDSDRNTKWGNGRSNIVEVTFNEPHYVSRVCAVDCDYLYYVSLSYEDTPDTFFGNKYVNGVKKGLTEFDPVSKFGYDNSRKVKGIQIRNYYGNIAEIYFFVYD